MLVYHIRALASALPHERPRRGALESNGWIIMRFPSEV